MPAAASHKLKPGERITRQKGNLVFTKWHDKSNVSILSTHVSPSQPDFTVRRKVVQKPAVVTAYRKRMGGLDRNDQFRKYYYIGRPSVKWYKYIFWFLIDTSICNSHILLNHYSISKGKSPGIFTLV